MGVGVEIYGEGGNLQASTDRFTMGLASTGALNMTYNAGGPQARVRGSVTVTGVNPVVVIVPTEETIFLERYQVNGNSHTYTFGALSSTPVGFQYWVFDVASNAFKDPAMASMGLQVFDPNLTLTYDAAMDVLEVVNFVEVTPPASVTGPGANHQGLSNMVAVPVPGGKRYGVAFCGLSNTQATKSYYQYSQYPGGGQAELPSGDDPGPGQEDQWVRTRMDTLWSGCRVWNGQLEVGIDNAEFFEGWTPLGGFEEFIRSTGVSRFMIVDLTNLSSTALPANPNAPTVNVSATQRSVTTAGTTQTTITPEVTLSISGGAAPYSIQWQYVSGQGEVQPYGSSTSTTFRTQVYNHPANSGYSAFWRARVTDAMGVVSFSPNVEFSHVNGAADVTPNALTLVPLTHHSNDNLAAVGDVTNVVGFNQPITLRFERYNFSGHIDGAAVYIYRGPVADQWGPWGTNGNYDAVFDPKGSAYSGVDLVFDPAQHQRVHYVIHARSDRGVQDCSFDLVVRNMSLPGSPIIANNRITMRADADNNWNRIAPISVPNLTGYVSNDPELYTDGRFFQVTGLQTSAYLRFQRNYNTLSQTGNAFTRRLLIFHSPGGTSGGPWPEANRSFVGAGTPENPNPYTDVLVNNGDWFYVQGWITTSAGKATASWGNEISWHDGTTIQGQLASFTVGGTVDNDDNFYAPDPNLDGIDWPGQGGNFNERIAAWATEYRAMSGINQNIQIRAQLSGLSPVNGYPMATGGNFHIDSGWRGSLGYIPWNSQGQVIAEVQPNEPIRLYTDVYSASGRRDTLFNVNMYNHTTGAFIDGHTSAGICDLDDNYNVITLEGGAWDSFTVPGGADVTTINNNGRNIRVSADATAHLLRVVISNYSGSMEDGHIRLKNYDFSSVTTSEIRGQHQYAVYGNGEFNAWVNPNEHIFFDATAASYSGPRNATFTVTVYDQTAGGRYLSQFNVAVNAGAADITPAAVSMSGIHAYNGYSNFAVVSSPTYTISGITQEIGCAVHYGIYNHNCFVDYPGDIEQPGEGNVGSGNSYVNVYRNGVHVATTPGHSIYGGYYENGAEKYQAVTLNFNNNDTVRFELVSELYGDYSAQVDLGIAGNIYLDTYPNGGFFRIGSFAANSNVIKPYNY